MGTALAGGPPIKSQRAGLPHWAPASGTSVDSEMLGHQPRAELGRTCRSRPRTAALPDTPGLPLADRDARSGSPSGRRRTRSGLGRRFVLGVVECHQAGAVNHNHVCVGLQLAGRREVEWIFALDPARRLRLLDPRADAVLPYLGHVEEDRGARDVFSSRGEREGPGAGPLERAPSAWLTGTLTVSRLASVARRSIPGTQLSIS